LTVCIILSSGVGFCRAGKITTRFNPPPTISPHAEAQEPTAHHHVPLHLPPLMLRTTSTSYTLPCVKTKYAHGTFSDLASSGFGSVSTTYAHPSDPATLHASRTMQYADLYTDMRTSLATSAAGPPTYEPYIGYRPFWG
jgi:hypothetical protein